MEWSQVSLSLSEVPCSGATFQFLAILGHEHFCHSWEVLQSSLAERPRTQPSFWGSCHFAKSRFQLLQNPHHCSYFRSGGNQFLTSCHPPKPFLSFPLRDIKHNLIKEFRFLQKSRKSFDFRQCLQSALQKKSPKQGIAKNWVMGLKVEEEEIQTE